MPVIRKVQKAVPGLAKFTGVESQGVLGMEFSNLIQPVIEVDDYLGPNGFSQVTSAAVAQNGNIEIPVPDKKFWRLKWVSVTVQPPVGVYTNCIIEVEPAETGLTYQLSPPILAYPAAGASRALLFGDAQISGYGVDVKGVNGRPGDIIRATLRQGSGAGNNNVRLFVQYQELDL